MVQPITVGNSQLRVAWNPVVGAASYEIYRSTTSGLFGSALASSLVNTSYTDDSVVNGIRYYYVVKAVNSFGASPPSNEMSATPNGPPSAPSNLAATTLSRSEIQLTWTPSPSGPTASGFKIERSKSGGSYSQVATVGAGVASYRDSGLSKRTTYSYRVRAYNGAGNSAYSNTVSAKTAN